MVFQVSDFVYKKTSKCMYFNSPFPIPFAAWKDICSVKKPGNLKHTHTTPPPKKTAEWLGNYLSQASELQIKNYHMTATGNISVLTFHKNNLSLISPAIIRQTYRRNSMQCYNGMHYFTRSTQVISLTPGKNKTMQGKIKSQRPVTVKIYAFTNLSSL